MIQWACTNTPTIHTPYDSVGVYQTRLLSAPLPIADNGTLLMYINVCFYFVVKYGPSFIEYVQLTKRSNK